MALLRPLQPPPTPAEALKALPVLAFIFCEGSLFPFAFLLIPEIPRRVEWPGWVYRPRFLTLKLFCRAAESPVPVLVVFFEIFLTK